MTRHCHRFGCAAAAARVQRIAGQRTARPGDPSPPPPRPHPIRCSPRSASTVTERPPPSRRPVRHAQKISRAAPAAADQVAPEAVQTPQDASPPCPELAADRKGELHRPAKSRPPVAFSSAPPLGDRRPHLPLPSTPRPAVSARPGSSHPASTTPHTKEKTVTTATPAAPACRRDAPRTRTGRPTRRGAAYLTESLATDRPSASSSPRCVAAARRTRSCPTSASRVCRPPPAPPPRPSLPVPRPESARAVWVRRCGGPRNRANGGPTPNRPPARQRNQDDHRCGDGTTVPSNQGDRGRRAQAGGRGGSGRGGGGGGPLEDGVLGHHVLEVGTHQLEQLQVLRRPAGRRRRAQRRRRAERHDVGGALPPPGAHQHPRGPRAATGSGPGGEPPPQGCSGI
jgi:hypothetical protein